MQLLLSPIGRLRPRLPAASEVFKVFSAVLFAVFSWSIRGFFYKIPSFTLYFGLSANLAILSYMLAFALVESVLATSVLLVLSLLLPAQAFKEGFAYKSFLLILVAVLAMLLFEAYYRISYVKDIMAHDYSSIPPFIIGAAASVIFLALLLWLLRRFPSLQQYPLHLMEQLSLFAFIYVPLGVLGLLVVLIRNLR